MIAECLIFLATAIPTNEFVDKAYIDQYRSCDKIITKEIRDHSDVLIEFFGHDNDELSTAIKVVWCESRGNPKALRTAEGNYDTGLFQFVSWTWNWVAEMYDLPMWNDWVIMYHDRPYTSEKVSRSSMGFSQEKAQYTKYYNTKFAYLLSQEIYKQKWKDWSSSEWCWGDTDKWLRLVKQERSM